MNILFITVRSDFGGGPKHIDQLIKNLPSNINIYMAYPQNGEPYASSWDNNTRIIEKRYIPYRKFSFKHLIQLQKFINENNINIVHSHGNGAGFYSRGLKLLGCKAKIIHTFHGISDQYTSKFKYILNILSGQIFKFFTDKFILVSNGELKSAKEKKILFENKSIVIYNGIENSSISKKTPKDTFNIVTISRFDFQKNMDFAYEIAHAFRHNTNIKFTWIGNGDDLEKLREKAKLNNVNIDFTGFTIEPLNYLAKGSIYLSTSRFEGLPYALIEAASLRIPIIATNVVGNNEIVIHGENGFLFTKKEEAINYINILYRDIELYNKMEDKAFTMYIEKFTIDSMISQLMSIYKNN